MKGGGIGNHGGRHFAGRALISGRRKPAEETRIVVGRRAEDIAGRIEAKPPSIVVELVQKGDIFAVGAHLKHAGAKAVGFARLFAGISGIANRAPNLVVESIAQIGRPRMSVANPPTGVQGLAGIRAIVSVQILQKKHIRRLRHDDSAAAGKERGGNVQSFGKNRHSVATPVRIRILQNFDPVVALPSRLDFVGIIDALRNP